MRFVIHQKSDKRSKSPLSLDTPNRRAIFDFSVLTVITQLSLAFIYVENSGFFLWLSLPYLVIAILSKLKQSAVYPAAAVVALISIIFGTVNGNFLNSLKEWVIFFSEGESLRFLELSHLILLIGYSGMGYFSVKKYFPPRNN